MIVMFLNLFFFSILNVFLPKNFKQQFWIFAGCVGNLLTTILVAILNYVLKAQSLKEWKKIIQEELERIKK